MFRSEINIAAPAAYPRPAQIRRFSSGSKNPHCRAAGYQTMGNGYRSGLAQARPVTLTRFRRRPKVRIARTYIYVAPCRAQDLTLLCAVHRSRRSLGFRIVARARQWGGRVEFKSVCSGSTSLICGSHLRRGSSPP